MGANVDSLSIGVARCVSKCECRRSVCVCEISLALVLSRLLTINLGRMNRRGGVGLAGQTSV